MTTAPTQTDTVPAIRRYTTESRDAYGYRGHDAVVYLCDDCARGGSLRYAHCRLTSAPVRGRSADHQHERCDGCIRSHVNRTFD